MNTKRLLKLADFLDNMGERLGVSEAEARKHFDLTDFVTHLEDATGPDWTPLICGSTACAIGWLPKVDPRNWKWELGTGWPMLKKAAGTLPFAAAEAYFGIDEHLTDYLFLPQLNYKTPKQVAKRIRAVVEHGGIPK